MDARYFCGASLIRLIAFTVLHNGSRTISRINQKKYQCHIEIDRMLATF